MKQIETLLNTPYWIMDILPRQVPKDSPGQYFAVEQYYLREELARIKRKHVNVILKLNCYRDISVEGETNPSPDRVRELMADHPVCILTDDSMILSEPDDTHMTVFNPDEDLLSLIRALAAGEGLFVWQP